MYCLSSAEALKEFSLDPRKFILPPLPQIPCKICVLGPPTSGKSTLAKMLADHYDAMVSLFVVS
jgi:adenylate/nucleoside-diphosphate kinase